MRSAAVRPDRLLKLVIDVPYYVLLVLVPASCAVAAWLALTSGPGKPLAVSLQVPVRFQLDPATHPLAAAPSGPKAATIGAAAGEIRLEGVTDSAVRWAGLLLAAIGMATVLVTLGLLRRVFGTLKDQDPFVPQNVQRVRAIGLVLIVGQLAYGAFAGWLAARPTRGVSIAGIRFEDAMPINGLVLFCGAILLVLAEVFRLGAQMKGDLETARRIQFALVPGEAFAKSDVLIQARMSPARAVGGDLYDVVDLDERRIAVAIGDVTGKGLPAALLMTSVVGSLRALLSAGLRGSELIRALNRHVCSNAPDGRFVTLFYAELDTGTGTLTYVNAGHNPPLLRRSDGAVEELGPTTMILGVMPEAAVEAGVVQLGSADRLLLFTDGLSEALNTKDEEYGDARLKGSLQSAQALAPPAAIDRLLADVRSFCGRAPVHDDMTLMLLARRSA